MSGTYYLTDQVTLETHVCGACGITFAAPTEFWVDRQRDKSAFYCPNGHNRIFLQETPEAKARRLAAQLIHERDQHEAERGVLRRRLSASKGQLTKTKRRIANGVCPCCQRTFANVARHMEHQHPDYVKTESA